MDTFRTFIFASMFVFGIANAKSVTCESAFTNLGKQKTNSVGVSITYAPVLNINGRVHSFPDHFYIEVYPSGEATPTSTLLLPYRSDVIGSFPIGREILHEDGLKAIYQNYGKRVPKKVVEAVMKVEAGLPMSRQAIFIVKNKMDSKLISSVDGFIRVFDGSIYNDGIRAIDSPALPLELILKKLNKSTSVVNQRRKQGYDVFEIGKYYLSDLLKGDSYDETRTDLLRWLLDYLDTRSEEMLLNSYFFIHVASDSHLKTYERYFGFKAEARSQSQNLDASENIMSIRGDELRSRLIDLVK